jgi:DNA-binding SARP family transcriptional activator/pimeloyl-ACP methyl ester carboxylesterase
MPELDFRILGPLEVLRDDVPIDMGTPRQRAVLVALLLRHSHVVPVDQLLDDLWGDTPPSGARHSLQVYVANLRKLLEPDAARGRTQVLVTRTPGYVLEIDDDALDARRFERLADEGRTRLAAGDAAGADELFRAGLALWRGGALSDLAYEDFALHEAERLEEARVVAIEDHIDARLLLGGHTGLVGEIEQLTRTHPLRERLWAQYILALYRSGRQAEALRAYEQLRATLRDELGVEPSRELRDLNVAVLEQSPDLDHAPATSFEPDDAPAPSAELPARRPRRRAIYATAVASVLGAVIAVAIAANASNKSSAVPAARGYTPRFVAHRCSADLTAAVPGVTCGWLVVPENRDAPSKRSIRLEVARYPAIDGRGSAGPLVSVGYSGLREDPARSPVRDHSELITIDTRVTLQPGETGLTCPDEAKLSTAYFASPSNDRKVSESNVKAFQHCYRQLTDSGFDLSHYTYDDAADDVIDLARAFHLERVNLTAEDEDSLVTYELVRRAPRLVRSITLQNPVVPGTTGIYDPTAELAHAFDAYIALCDADARCHSAYPDLDGALRRDEQRVAAHPILATGSAYGATYRVLLDPPRSSKELIQALTDHQYLNIVASGIYEPFKSLDVLASLVLQADYFWSVPGFPWATALSQWCSYDVYNLSPGRDISAQTRSDLAGGSNDDLPRACAVWPVKKMPEASFTPPPPSTVPILIFYGGLDAFVLPQWPTQLQNGFKDAVVARFQTLGQHITEQDDPPCINDLRRKFIADPHAPLPVAACEAQSPKINFVTP